MGGQSFDATDPFIVLVRTNDRHCLRIASDGGYVHAQLWADRRW